MSAIAGKSFVSPEIAAAATSRRTEQEARIEHLKRLAASYRARGRTRVTIKLRDLECMVAVMAIPFDIEREWP